MLAVICLFSSCLKNDNEVVTYDDTAVTSFTLGTVRCYRTVKASDGSDSTYSYTYSASSTPIYIDQVNKRIYNEDSLSVGSDLSRVLVTINTKNNGIARFKSVDSDEWQYYSTADSVDLSQVRTLRVTSSDGLHNADYTVNIVAHKEYADSFSWYRMPSQAEIGTLVKMQAAQTDGGIFLLGADGNSMRLLNTADGETWTECALPAVSDPVAAGFGDATVTAINGKLYMYSGGVIYSTADGRQWDSVTPDVMLASFAGGCDGEWYGIGVDDKIYVSRDNGHTWQQDAMESSQYVDNTPYLPASDITLLSSVSRTNSDIQRVTMIGNKAYTGVDDDFATAVVWNKVVDAVMPQTWTYTNVAKSNKTYVLPRMRGLSAIMYADGILATGGTPLSGTGKAYSAIYYSPDYGVTWHVQKGMSMPAGVAGAACATMVADGKGYFYVIASNPAAEDAAERCVIWKGKKNSVLWEKK